MAGGERIDWLLVDDGVEVPAAAIDTYRSRAGRYPSDHALVHALVRLR